jgi:hypothetical protein
MLPLPLAEPDPAKSLLHEKLYEKNAAMAKGFSSWVDEHYNLVKDKNIFKNRSRYFLFCVSTIFLKECF